MYEEFLGSVELLDNMSSYERMQLADALLEREYKEDEYII